MGQVDDEKSVAIGREARAVRGPQDAQHLTASGLSTQIACAHAMLLDRAHAAGQIAGPSGHDPTRELLAERGRRHEAAYVASLRRDGLRVEDLRSAAVDDVERTLAVMREGVDAIVQAPIGRDGWRGRADVLLRVDRASPQWPWSYEVVDTKLARQTKVATILQLGLYSEWLAALQGGAPERFAVVMPGQPFRIEHHRVADFAAYVRTARRRFERALAVSLEDALRSSRPEPCEHCEVCPWWKDCETRWRGEDHLSFVAGLTTIQRRELERTEIRTLADLATRPERLPTRPAVGARESYVRAHHQARVQFEGRQAGEAIVEWLEGEAQDLGVADLPSPSAMDLFLDLEGDPFVDEGGREYLFGLSWVGPDGEDEYVPRWALDPVGERAAFEATIDEIIARLDRDPAMHVYHFGVYEPGALKRLVGRYATRIDELDRLLRAEVFVDLHRVVKRSLRASVETYSLKGLEAVFGYARDLDLREAKVAMRRVDAALELCDPDAIDAALREQIERYNADDCYATRRLRDWLEDKRGQLERERGVQLVRPEGKSGDPNEAIAQRDAEVDAVMTALLEGVPEDPDKRDDEQRAKALLAHMLEFHRREHKASYWEFFRLREMMQDEREQERKAIAGLSYLRTEHVKQSCVHWYGYPSQETAIETGDKVFDDAELRAQVYAHDKASREIAIKIGNRTWAARPQHPAWIFAHKTVDPGPKPQALLALARSILAGGTDEAWSAARALLFREPPRMRAGVEFAAQAGESAAARACRVVLGLDRSVLAIQGPPGTGKTTTGAQMIVRLVAEGKRVGVTAMSHAVIRNLLEKVLATADATGMPIAIGAKPESEDGLPARIRAATDNAAPRSWLCAGEVQVVGGTAWMWSRPEYAQSIDVLFVDEAGQLALADVLSVAAAAQSVVLLGDPQQLEQPHKATHPEGSDVSALAHVLDGEKTIDARRGVFLEQTWRLPPRICALTSSLFYDGRLRGRAGSERRRLIGTGELAIDEAGLWFVPVQHTGRTVVAHEEVDAIDGIVTRLLGGGVSWVDDDGVPRDLGADDVLVIAPYNAQVGALSDRLRGHGVRVGTVDKFQGQEAQVVIVSATSSTAEDVPRGMAFLYSAHRFNVATSRARVACVLVGSERLFEAECRRVGQAKLVNGWCAFREAAGAARSP